MKFEQKLRRVDLTLNLTVYGSTHSCLEKTNFRNDKRAKDIDENTRKFHTTLLWECIEISTNSTSF